MLSQIRRERSRRFPAKDLVWTVSAEGFISSLSIQAARITGWSEVDWLGKPFHSFIHPDEIPRVRDSYAKVLRGEMASLENVRCLARNGSYLAWALSLVPDIQHGVLGEVLVLGRLEENERPPRQELPNHPQNPLQLYSEKEKSLASGSLEYAGLTRLMESLLANAPVGFALLDEELRFICLNQTFSRMTAFSPEQQLGKPFKEFLPKVAHLIVPLLTDILATGRSVIDYEVVLGPVTAVGFSRYAQMSFYPIPNGYGETCGVALIALDITDRKRSEERLIKVSEELVRSNQALEGFSYIASHDLKEPLRTISMFVKLVEKKCQGILDKDGQDYINFAISGADRMRRLVDKILEYSTTGKTEKEVSAVDCSKILLTIASNLKVSLEESQGTITYDPLPTVAGDEFLLLQVFQNLIANAIKYRSSAPPEIHVGVRKEANAWVFSIADNGIGINQEYFSDIFAPFRKLHSQSEYVGSGLGLAICQKNIERHGGRIWVQSQEGKGSTFYFTIPVARSEESLNHESTAR